MTQYIDLNEKKTDCKITKLQGRWNPDQGLVHMGTGRVSDRGDDENRWRQ